MFTIYSDLDYLKIDIANAAGQDKKLFEERINWFNQNIPDSVVTLNSKELLEFCQSFNPDSIESIELMFTGLQAYQDYWFKRPSGYRCQLDAICSGASIMSALTADKRGLMNTGLIGNKRGDLYTAVYETMKTMCNLPDIYSRSDIKKPTMTFLYGSNAQPEETFNDDKKVIEAFWKAVETEAKGAYELQMALTTNWNPKATFHHWVLPDGFEVHIPVIVDKEFKYTLKENNEEIEIPFRLKVKGTKKHSVSNCANSIHSVDSMIVREMTRRCMFNMEHVQEVLWYLVNTKEELYEPLPIDDLDKLGKLGELIYYYNQSKFCSIRIIDEIKSQADTYKLSKEHREKLISILSKMVQHGYIETCAIHDCFTALPKHMNYIRYWYKEMLADIVESNLLVYLYNQINISNYFEEDPISKTLRKSIAKEVRNSNYGLS